MTEKDFRSNCPLATALDILGDKWTLLVVRDLLFGARRFSEFMDSPESMRSNILTDRLNRLEAEGVITKRPYQENPVRYEYELTKKGKALHAVLRSIVDWSNRFYPHTYRPFEAGEVRKPEKEELTRR